jgi:hypothetical protein
MAINISYTCATGSSVSVPIDKVIKMRVTRKYYDPARVFTFSCVVDTPPTSPPIIITINIDGKAESFSVAQYTYENKILTVSGRGLVHRLMDAGVLPAEKFSFSSAALTSEYITPYYSGGTEFPGATPLSIFWWRGNISAWDVVDAYSRQRFERIPRINALNKISVYTLNSTAHISLGEQTAGAKAIAVSDQDFSVVDNSSGIIRKIYVNQSDIPEVPDFSYVETNPYSVGNNVQKVMYWTPPDAYIVIRNATARTMIYQSTMTKTKINLKYPVFYNAHTGDVVKFKDDRYEGGSLRYMYIGEYDAKFDGGQWTTSFQLWDTRYLLPWAASELSGKGIPIS